MKKNFQTGVFQCTHQTINEGIVNALSEVTGKTTDEILTVVNNAKKLSKLITLNVGDKSQTSLAVGDKIKNSLPLSIYCESFIQQPQVV